MVKKIGKILFIALVAGLLLYAFVYFMASQGDAFGFAEQTVVNSSTIKRQVGEIKRVRLDPFGPYIAKTIGNDEWVTMVIEVAGTEKSVVVYVSAKKTDGTWKIEQTKIEDREK